MEKRNVRQEENLFSVYFITGKDEDKEELEEEKLFVTRSAGGRGIKRTIKRELSATQFIFR